MILEDDYSPIRRGDTGAKFVPTFRSKNGKPYDLTGATLSLKMVNTSDKSVKDGTGTWHVDDAINGATHYDYGTNDVAEEGEFDLWAIATVGGAPVHADPLTLVIEWAPT